MSFRKRGEVIGTPRTVPVVRTQKTLPEGTRPSPFDGRLTTSTGTASLDQLLAGHAGLPMGTSLLIEENGTTDFSGTLLRYYAAEGLVQGHGVHVLGLDDSWRRELPGLGVEGKSKSSKNESTSDKMKIAWRYETLGNRPAPARGKTLKPIFAYMILICNVTEPQATTSTTPEAAATFCHTFNLTKRLDSSAIKGQLTTSPITGLVQPGKSFFKDFIVKITALLKNSPPSSIHRIVVPSLLSPTLYPSSACCPEEVLQFLHALRGLLRQYPTRLTALVTFPVSLFSRQSGLTKWIELLFDGVLELVPLQQQIQPPQNPTAEEKSQGLLTVHSLPIFHEKGGGMDDNWRREDLSFKLSASSGLVITPFSLPPIGEDEQQAKDVKASEDSKTAKSLEF